MQPYLGHGLANSKLPNLKCEGLGMGPATRAEAVRRWEACFGNWGRWVGEGQTQLSQQASSSLGGAESGTPNSLLYVQIGLWELSLNLRKKLGSDQEAESSSSQELGPRDLVNQSVEDVGSEDRASL